MLVEAVVSLMLGDELLVDLVLVILGRVVRYLHDGRCQVVEAVLVNEGASQLRAVDADGVLVVSVHAVVGHAAVRAVDLEEVREVVDTMAPVILEGVRLDKVERDLLNGRAIEDVLTLALERVGEYALVHHLARDAVHEDVHELVEVLAVHGAEEELRDLGHAVLVRVGHALLEVGRSLQIGRGQNRGVVCCHGVTPLHKV